MEYQVVYMDPALKMSHKENERPIAETDDLAWAFFIANAVHEFTKAEICVYQPRHNTYRCPIYGRKDHHSVFQDRQSNGRFKKAQR